MKYVEETVEEIQPDGSIVLRRVVISIPTYVDEPAHPAWGMIIIPVWGDPEEE